MPTRDTIQRYFEGLSRRNGWESTLADNMVFTSLTSPTKRIEGKDGFLQATRRFYSMIDGVDVRELIVDGDRACALTRYALRPPNGGAAFQSDVAEVFSVRDDRIASFDIYFDTSPYPK